MTEKILTNCLIAQVHKDIVAELNLQEFTVQLMSVINNERKYMGNY